MLVFTSLEEARSLVIGSGLRRRLQIFGSLPTYDCPGRDSLPNRRVLSVPTARSEILGSLVLPDNSLL